MHSTRKGQQWPCRVKLHFGVDAVSGVVQCLQTAAVHVHDLQQQPHPLHGQGRTEGVGVGDLRGPKRPARRDLDLHCQIATRAGHRRDPRSTAYQAERHKVSVRAKVAFPCPWVKQVFGHARLR